MSNKVHISQADSLLLASANDDDVLGGGALFVGDVKVVTGYTHIAGFAFSDVVSASPAGIIIEQGLSPDDFPAGVAATTLVTTSTHILTAGEIIDNALQVQIVAPFARIIYVNGAGAQSTFRLYFTARILRGL